MGRHTQKQIEPHRFAQKHNTATKHFSLHESRTNFVAIYCYCFVGEHIWSLGINYQLAYTHTRALTQIVLLLLDNKTKWVAKFGNIRNELQKKIKHYLETWRSLRPRWHWNACIYRKNQITIKYNKIKADFSITMN